MDNLWCSKKPQKKTSTVSVWYLWLVLLLSSASPWVTIKPKDVTVPRVAIFRDAIVDLFDMELGTRHVYRWILHHLISEIPIYLCYKIVILPSGKRMLSACSRRVRKGSEERKCPAYLYAQRVFFKLEWLMFVMFPRSFLFGMFANSWVSVLRKLELISYCLGSQVVYCSFSSISCWFEWLYLLLGNDQTLGFQPLGLRCKAWRWSQTLIGSLPRWGPDFLLSWTTWVEPLSTFAIWLHHSDLYAAKVFQNMQRLKNRLEHLMSHCEVYCFFPENIHSSTKKYQKINYSPLINFKKNSPRNKE